MGTSDRIPIFRYCDSYRTKNNIDIILQLSDEQYLTFDSPIAIGLSEIYWNKKRNFSSFCVFLYKFFWRIFREFQRTFMSCLHFWCCGQSNYCCHPCCCLLLASLHQIIGLHVWVSDWFFFSHRNIEYRTGEFCERSDNRISDQGLNLSDYRISDAKKNYRLPS